MSLYRKWRPQTFAELKGQNIIRDTIFYALANNQLAHAYLFCGPRGTGKTTTARLIAKYINCTDEKEKPCNTCQACMSITDGTNLDILEVDAASNRGIDEIRQLRDSVRFTPTQAKYKVFIVDEVHMLTREAFNALLKTLEEPPTHAIFILATTEAHKIPATIISRCQRYDFAHPSVDMIAEHLQFVAKEEGMQLEHDAAKFLARLADGSFRDSLSLLERVRSVEKPVYSLAVLEEIFGYVAQEQVAGVLAAILAGDTKSAHDQLDAVVARGGDVKAFCDQLLGLSQLGLEALVLNDYGDVPGNLTETLKRVGMGKVVQWLELLLTATQQMKQSPILRLPLDVAIAKYAVALGTAPTPVQVAPAAAPAAVVAPQPKPMPASPPKPVAPPSNPAPAPSAPAPVVTPPASAAESPTVSVPVAVEIVEAIPTEQWQAFLNALKADNPSLVTSLAHARMLGKNENVIQIGVKFKMHADKINQVKNREKLAGLLTQTVGQPLSLEAVVVKDLEIEEEEVVDLSQVFDFE